MRQIIGIGGKIGHGKDAIANRLVSKHGFTILRFSDALKNEVVDRLPRTLTAIHRALGYSQPWQPEPTRVDLKYLVSVVKPTIVRELLQEYGTEVRRADTTDYWVNLWVQALMESRSDRIVAPDMRFPNEFDAVTSRGGHAWYVERPGMGETSTHASETELKSMVFSYRIFNTGTLEQLDKMTDALVERLT